MGTTKERKQELLELKRKKNNEKRKRNYEKKKILKQEGLKLKAKKRLSNTYCMRLPGKGNTEKKSSKQQRIRERKRLKPEKVTEKDSRDAETKNYMIKGALSQLRMNILRKSKTKVHFNLSIGNLDSRKSHHTSFTNKVQESGIKRELGKKPQNVKSSC